MKFLSGTRNRSITYVVEPSRPYQDMTTGRYTYTEPLRAKFSEHQFDSEADSVKQMCELFARSVTQKDAPVTAEDVRKKIEKYLLDHPDFGRSDGRGIFIDNSATLSDQELRAKGVQRRCLFMQDIGGETIQCQEIVDDPDSDFCGTHEPLVVAATSAPKE